MPFAELSPRPGGKQTRLIRMPPEVLVRAAGGRPAGQNPITHPREEMEPRGFEPLTSAMPLRRSTN